MTELQQNRYDQLLRRVGDLKGPGSKVNNVLADVFPTIDVENVPAELLLPQGSKLCMGQMALAAGGAGNFGQIFLRVAAGTGIVATILQIHVTGAANATIFLGPTQNSLTPGGSRAFVDGRVFGEGTVAVIQGTNTNLAAGSTFYRLRTGANQGAEIKRERGLAVVTPGTAFSVGPATANEIVQASFLWVEREATPSELAL